MDNETLKALQGAVAAALFLAREGYCQLQRLETERTDEEQVVLDTLMTCRKALAMTVEALR